MTDKELKEWEEECKEADQDIKHIFKIVIIAGVIIAMLYLLTGCGVQAPCGHP